MTEEKIHPPRTNQQNKSLHLWCRQVAETLNDAGLEVKRVLTTKQNMRMVAYLKEASQSLTTLTNEHAGPAMNVCSGAVNKINKVIALMESGVEIDIPWTEKSVKELLWRPVMEALTNETSTTKIDRIEPTVITDTITRHISENHSITLPPFPNRFNQREVA